MEGIVGCLEKIHNDLIRIALALEALQCASEGRGIKICKDKEYNYKRP